MYIVSQNVQILLLVAARSANGSTDALRRCFCSSCSWCQYAVAARVMLVAMQLLGRTAFERDLEVQVCVQLPTYADYVALPAFALRTPILLRAGQQSIDVSCAPGPRQQICRQTDRQTDGRTPFRYTDHAPHTMRAVPRMWTLSRHIHVFPCTCIIVPWLGGRKGIRPVKNCVVGCWRGCLSAARCRLAYGPSDATATHCLLLQ